MQLEKKIEKMVMQVRKLLERERGRPKEKLRYLEVNSKETWCGPEKASKSWEQTMPMNFPWANSKSTNGGGTKHEKEAKKLILSLQVALNTFKIIYKEWAQIYSFRSKTNSEVTAVDFV